MEAHDTVNVFFEDVSCTMSCMLSLTVLTLTLLTEYNRYHLFLLKSLGLTFWTKADCSHRLLRMSASQIQDLTNDETLVLLSLRCEKSLLFFLPYNMIDCLKTVDESDLLQIVQEILPCYGRVLALKHLLNLLKLVSLYPNLNRPTVHASPKLVYRPALFL